VTGVTDVASRQETMIDGAKRIAKTNASALKERITDLHETVSDAFDGVAYRRTRDRGRPRVQCPQSIRPRAKPGLRVGDTVGATDEKTLREHAETTYNTTESQADRKGRDSDMHHHLASSDPAQSAGAMATLKARRSDTAPRFD